MFNMLRMDLYKMTKSKSVYVCLAVLLSIEVLCFVMIWLIAIPEGQKVSQKMGEMIEYTGKNEGGEWAEVQNLNTLSMYRDANMDGGVYYLIYGIVITLFVCMDFRGGFVKNIMTLHRERWKYIGSKIMAAGILNFIYITVTFAFNILLNLLFHTMVPFSSWGDSLFYLAWAWFLTTAFGALIILFCVLTRSMAVGTLAASVFGSGMLVVPLSSVMNYFGLGGWFEYTLYYNMTYGPSRYSSIGDLKCFGIGMAFLALYSVASAVVLAKQDI